MPTLPPTTLDALTVAVALSFTTSSQPSSLEKANLKSMFVTKLDLSASQIKNFNIISSPTTTTTTTSSSSTASMRLRHLLTTFYSWTVSFDIQLSLASTSYSSRTDYASSVSTIVSSAESDVSSQLNMTISGFDSTTELVTSSPTFSPTFPPNLLPTLPPTTTPVIVNDDGTNNNNGDGNNNRNNNPLSAVGIGSVYLWFGVAIVAVAILSGMFYCLRSKLKSGSQVEGFSNENEDIGSRSGGITSDGTNKAKNKDSPPIPPTNVLPLKMILNDETGRSPSSPIMADKKLTKSLPPIKKKPPKKPSPSSLGQAPSSNLSGETL
jgi:hypothetical protein